MQESETKKLSRQCKLILGLLEDLYWHSGGEIYEQTKVIKYSTRISDLRLIYKCDIIKRYRDGQWWYKLMPVIKPKLNPYGEAVVKAVKKQQKEELKNNLKLI